MKKYFIPAVVYVITLLAFYVGGFDFNERGVAAVMALILPPYFSLLAYNVMEVWR